MNNLLNIVWKIGHRPFTKNPFDLINIEGHCTICSVKYLFGGDFTLARIFGEMFFPLEKSDIEFANIL